MSQRDCRDEKLAAYVLEQDLNVPVRLTDCGGQHGNGRADLAFGLPDGAGIAEVVSLRDPEQESLSEAIARGSRRKPARSYTSVPGLRYRWALQPPLGTLVKELRSRLPEWLAELESLGIGHITPTVRCFQLPERLQGVPDGFPIEPPPGECGGYYLLERVVGGFPGSGDRALERCEDFLAGRPDKAAKVLREGQQATHRHLVLLLDLWSPIAEGMFRFLQDYEPGVPLRPPSLQAGVTGLWLVPLYHFPPTCPVLYWPTGGDTWKFQRVTPQAAELPTGV